MPFLALEGTWELLGDAKLGWPRTGFAGNVLETYWQRVIVNITRGAGSVQKHGCLSARGTDSAEGEVVNQKIRRASLEVAGENREFTLARPSVRDYAMLEELSFVRREAQAEADQAYERWTLDHGHDAYVVYRAAQDRADAAQDQLARWSRRLAA
jgi:hypothetical protein